MTTENQNPPLGEAVNEYLSGLKAEDKKERQQELTKFARWFGRERLVSDLQPSEVESYSEQLSSSNKDYVRNFDASKAFLAFAKKKGWTKTNLSVHMKIKVKAAKSRTKKTASSRKEPESVTLTKEGHAKLKAELADLQNEQQAVIAEIHKAAADKDFRENTPFHAARERKGHIDGKILELEGLMKSALILDETQKSTFLVGMGDSVVICEVGSESEVCYTLVSPREVDLKKGKISNVSPVGQAIMGREQGETVEISAPIGKLHYRIVRIER